jgi:hypothetical protein
MYHHLEMASKGMYLFSTARIVPGSLPLSHMNQVGQLAYNPHQVL